jgi:DNA-directed RNA polymerase specialized sigma24 family protein
MGLTMTDGTPDKTPDQDRAAAGLLAEVYAELRRLAAGLMSRLAPGQTLQPTALVHEAYLRLVRGHDPGWEGRRHFFGAIEPPADDLLALDEAITRLQAEEPHLAEIVMLRYYTGLTVEETAAVVGESDRTVYRDWRRARAWLARQLGGPLPDDAGGRP